MQRTYKLGVRLLIAIAAYSFVAIKIDWDELLKVISNFPDSFLTNNLYWFILVILLMPLGWALEAYKWRFAISNITNISFWRSWRSVWYGLVAGQLTPNRIGEPIGRLALIDSESRGKAGILAILCSSTQQIATIFFGLLSAVWWSNSKGYNILPSEMPLWLTLCLIFCWVGLILFGIIKIKQIARKLEKLKWTKNILHGETLRIKLSISSILIVQLMSLIRYVVFSTQFVILLRIFGVNADLPDLYAVVGLTYLFGSLIPSFSVSEVGVKAGFAIWFASMISDNTLGVAAASLLIWFLNLAIPTLIVVWFPWKEERGMAV